MAFHGNAPQQMRPDEEASLVAELFKSAAELPPQDRQSFLDERCRSNPDLRAEVESLLQTAGRAEKFLETPAAQMAAKDFLQSGAFAAGQIIGHYKILSLIGKGGMGEVYLAQDRQLHRRVALKLVRRGMDTDQIVRRFLHEQRLLAGLNHPNIAQLYDADVTPDGIPFFAMEHVDGTRIDDYCREKSLTIEQRLELFGKVCAAIHYAHQHLVVHRDIKPSNILVTNDGEPKLLDFGIAKVLDAVTNAAPEQTITLQNVMTPEYASPEHVRGEGITTASDVYSLGVLLYELLTDRRPYKIENRTPIEIARVITEKEPTKPSATISNQKSLRGDLDNIVLMAMRKEPQRRYSSVAQFSADICRHLDGLPVRAQKNTFAYRSSKFVRRHRMSVAVVALLFVGLIAGIVAIVWQARAAERQRLRAERISAFLQETLSAAAPEVKGIDVKVSDVLEEASRRAQNELANQPEVLADILTTLGHTYVSLGVYAPAIRDLRAAMAAASKARSNRAEGAASAWLAMALEYHQESAEARRVAQYSVALNRRIAPKGNIDLAVALAGLGASEMDLGDAEGAVTSLKEAVALARKYFGETHGYYLAALNMLALVHQQKGDFVAAQQLYRQVLDAGQRVDSRYRIYLAQAAAYLGRSLIETGDYREAEQRLLEAESTYRTLLGEKNSSVPVLKTHLGEVYFHTGDYNRAEASYRQALEMFPVYFAANDLLALNAKASLGQVLVRQGKPEEAEHFLREALKTRQRISPVTNTEFAYNETLLGESLLAQKRFAEAELLLAKAYQQLHRNLSDSDSRIVETRSDLERLYQAWNKPDRAAQYH